MQKEEKGESSESCGSLQAQVCRRNQEEGRRSIRIQRKTDRWKRSREGLPPEDCVSARQSEKLRNTLSRSHRCTNSACYSEEKRGTGGSPFQVRARNGGISRRLSACSVLSSPERSAHRRNPQKEKEKEKEKRQGIDRSMGPAPKPSLNGTQSGEAHSKRINPKFTVLPCAVIGLQL